MWMQEITRTVLVEWDELNTLDVPLMLDKEIIFFFPLKFFVCLEATC